MARITVTVQEIDLRLGMCHYFSLKIKKKNHCTIIWYWMVGSSGYFFIEVELWDPNFKPFISNAFSWSKCSISLKYKMIAQSTMLAWEAKNIRTTILVNKSSCHVNYVTLQVSKPDKQLSRESRHTYIHTDGRTLWFIETLALPKNLYWWVGQKLHPESRLTCIQTDGHTASQK